jgi:hypothetical protein
VKSIPCLSSPRRFAIFRSLLRSLSTSCVLVLALTAGLFRATLSFAHAQDISSGQARGLFLDTRPSDNKGTPSKASGRPGRMGLGYTLFVEQGGSAKRVSPDHIFHSGDRVRILVETNREVYLYVFHQEGPGSADLLFPDSRLRGGENIVSAHQPSYIPNTGWFTFDNHAGDEKLTLVASEKPLEGVPRRSELKGTEAFQMSPDLLARLVANSVPAMQDAQADEGKAMTATEGTRGLALSMNDPPPSRLVMNKTTQSGWITAQVVLTHR